MDQKIFISWIEAARPQTLPAAFVPVLVGSTVAFHANEFLWIPSLVALLCAFLIQIGTNFANDYYDYIKGADTDDRLGFTRATASGKITARQMWTATVGTMGLAFLVGLYLVWIGGWQILLIGVCSLIFGIAYTGGPYPIGYNGLGDIFVFIFFGIIAVMGTHFVNALQWSAMAFWASIPVGALAVNILVVNNLRDIEQDKQAGKKTLGVLLGEQALKWEYLFMLLLAFAIPPHFYFKLNFGYWIWLPFFAVPFAIKLLHTVWTHTNKRKLNDTLKYTAMFMTLFGVLFSVGMVLS